MVGFGGGFTAREKLLFRQCGPTLSPHTGEKRVFLESFALQTSHKNVNRVARVRNDPHVGIGQPSQ